MLLFLSRPDLIDAGDVSDHALRSWQPGNLPCQEEPSLLVIDRFSWEGASPDTRTAWSEGETKIILTGCDGVPNEEESVFARLPDLPAAMLKPVLCQFIEAAARSLSLERDMKKTRRNLSDMTQITLLLSSEKTPERLLELILLKARELTNADGGSLYLVEEEESGDARLRFKLSQSDSIRQSFKEFTMPISRESTAGYAALTGESVVLDDAYAPREDVPYRHNPSFDLKNNYRTVSMLTVPLSTLKGEVLGVLQLINRKRRAQTILENPETAIREVHPFSPDEIELVKALASSAAVTLEKIRLYEEIQTLFEGFVKASVKAIESTRPRNQRPQRACGHVDRGLGPNWWMACPTAPMPVFVSTVKRCGPSVMPGCCTTSVRWACASTSWSRLRNCIRANWNASNCARI